MLLYLFGGSFVVFRESFVEYCFVFGRGRREMEIRKFF